MLCFYIGEQLNMQHYFWTVLPSVGKQALRTSENTSVYSAACICWDTYTGNWDPKRGLVYPDFSMSNRIKAKILPCRQCGPSIRTENICEKAEGGCTRHISHLSCRPAFLLSLVNRMRISCAVWFFNRWCYKAHSKSEVQAAVY